MSFIRLLCLTFFSFLFFNTSAQQLPIPDWVKDIGGTGESKVSGIAVDKFDNVYVSGNFQGTVTVDLSGVSNPINLTSNGSYDFFIAKYSANGKLIWAKSIGGTALEQSNNLAVDKDGNVIVGGSFGSSSVDFDPGVGTSIINNVNGDDAFIVKLDSDGNYLWAKSVASASTERGHVVTSDNLGNVIFVGSFSGSLNLGAYPLINKGNFDGFIVKYSPAGTILWAYGFGSPNIDEIKSIKADSNNEIVILGYFGTSVDVNPKGPANIINGGSNTYFIAKYTESGLLKWVNKIEATGAVIMSSIAVGPTDDIFITGDYYNQINLYSAVNTISLVNPGHNLVIAKYNSTGTSIWARNITSTASNPYSYYITADAENNTYIGGYFDHTLTFTDGTNNKTITYNGTKDTFFARFSGLGNFNWAFNFGSNCSGNYGHKIAVDSKKNVLLGGAFCQTVDFNPGSCNYNLTAKNSASDGFISKYNQIKLTGDASIINFELTEQASPAIIDEATKTIKIKVKPGTDLSKLKPFIETDIGIITPLSGVETNFSTPKTYTITSNCDDYNWTVTVSITTNFPELCSDKVANLLGSVILAPNPTFQWEQGENGTWSDIISATSKDISFSYSNHSALKKTINLRRKVTINGIDAYDSSQDIVILPSTTNNLINTSSTIICNGNANISIQGSVLSGAENSVITYKWQTSFNAYDWLEAVGETAKDFTPKEFYQTTFFRRITYADLCEAYSNELKIEVYPPLTISSAGDNISLCNTNSTILNANPVQINETGSWSVISPAGYSPFDATNINNPKTSIQNIPENTDVILQWTINQNICGTQSSSQVHVFNFGAPTITLPKFITINEGQTLPIPSAITGSPDVTYTYQWTPANFLDNPNILSPSVSPEETSIYKLTVSYGSCNTEKEIKIIVNKAKRLSMCGGSTLTLTGAVDNDSQSIYQWQELVGGVWTDLLNANTETYNLSVAKNFGNIPEDREYRRKVVNAPYFDSRYIVTVAPTTDNNVINTTINNYCQVEVQNQIIQGSIPTGAPNAVISYKWQKSIDGSTWDDLTDFGKDLTVASITKTTFYRRITYADLCEAYSNELKIQLFEPRTVSVAGINTSMCNATSFALNASEVQANEIGTWYVISPSNYQPFDEVSKNNPKAVIENLPQNQVINLKWSINNYNCGGSSSSDFTIISYKDITISGETAHTINLSNKVALNVVTDLAPNIPSSIDWSPKTGLNRYDILNPIASPQESTIYTLTINYGENCFKKFTTKITVLKKLDIPNSFSPNSDGMNDKWEIKNLSEYVGSVVTIFNRYGAIVYQSFTGGEAWDGTNKGKRLPTGVYYYVIKLNNIEKSVFTGSVTLLQ